MVPPPFSFPVCISPISAAAITAGPLLSMSLPLEGRRALKLDFSGLPRTIISSTFALLSRSSAGGFTFTVLGAPQPLSFPLHCDVAPFWIATSPLDPSGLALEQLSSGRRAGRGSGFSASSFFRSSEPLISFSRYYHFAQFLPSLERAQISSRCPLIMRRTHH